MAFEVTWYPSAMPPQIRSGVCSIALGLALAALLLGGCATLTSSEKDLTNDLKLYGIDTEVVYSQGGAMGMNFLFGAGNFYLGQTAVGILNFMLWPASILWAPAQAWIDAPTLNNKATVRFYRTYRGRLRARSQFDRKGIAKEDWPYWLR
jgi:hypothetical protein